MTQEGCSWPGDAELEVHRRISLFGLDPVDTLRFLGKTGSFISGSVPVPVLAGIRFVPNDIDFYCPEKAEAEFQEWLVDQQGFELTRSIEQKYPATRAIKEMTWYVKDGKVVNVMSVRGDSPALAMPQFHSTIVMNMICYKGLYCAYPKLTRRRLSLRVDPSRRNRVGRARADECIEKYTGRGLGLLGAANHLRGSANCPATERTLQDGHGAFFEFLKHRTDEISLTACSPLDPPMRWTIGPCGECGSGSL